MEMTDKAKQARQASAYMAGLSTEQKNEALKTIAAALQSNKDQIIAANEKDIEKSKQNNLSAPLLKRLKFDESKLDKVVQGIYSLIDLAEPVGQTIQATELDRDLELYKVSCPIGVIGIIFESRPDALVQISALGLKSGNSVLLKGGSEAEQTNNILSKIIINASVQAGIPEGWMALMETRDDVNQMLTLDQSIDLIIPRGSKEFVRYIMNHSNIPVLGHTDGVCHVYVDEKADLSMAEAIVTDSKTQYVAVCNAAETLLVHEHVANELLPRIKQKLDEFDVDILGCSKTADIIDVYPANESTWETEYLDYKLSVKVVSGIEEALEHINRFGSSHTDSIVTADKATAAHFLELVDSANVFWNCSTRFSDGYRYGLGAEVGISTNKIHARGPVGLEGLLIYKWKLLGNGQIVRDYADGNKTFKHQALHKHFPLGNQ